MIVIMGLGNPGFKYQKTRHNIGQVVLRKFANDFYFPKFKLDENLQARISEKNNVLLVLPVTFMNESGISAGKLIKKDVQLHNFWVIHDDLDIGLGRIKISFNSSSAGHKGVQSIIDKLASQNFVRFRVGIKNLDAGFVGIEKFVLQKFNRKEKKIVEQSVNLTCEAIQCALNQGVEKARLKYCFLKKSGF